MGDNTNRLSPQQVEDKFKEYLVYCEENRRFANIAGFSVFANIGRKTWYDYTDLHGNEFSHTIKTCFQLLEDAVVNNKTVSPSERIFYLKNKFNYADKQEIRSYNTNLNTDVHNMTDEEIEKELKELGE